MGETPQGPSHVHELDYTRVVMGTRNQNIGFCKSCGKEIHQPTRAGEGPTECMNPWTLIDEPLVWAEGPEGSP